MKNDGSLLPSDPVGRVPGIGPKRREILAAAGIESVLDLLLCFPLRWDDRRHFADPEDLAADGRRFLLRGRLCNMRFRRARFRRTGVVSGALQCGRTVIPVVFFNAHGIPAALKDPGEICLFGPLGKDRRGVLQLVNPEIVPSPDDSTGGGVCPVYRAIGPIGASLVRKIVGVALEAAEEIEDPLGEDRPADLPEIRDALCALHRPASDADVGVLNAKKSRAHRRIFFDELLHHFLRLEERRLLRRRLSAIPVRIDPRSRDDLYGMFPFQLTGAQIRVLSEILSDMDSTTPMARLLQGDVGSGKTAVAALCMAATASSYRQAVLMAPTEILAEQHFRVLEELFSGTGWKVVLLHGGLAAGTRREALRSIADGEALVIVGTHALIQESARFSSLALVIIDEQHRFGTLQRRELVLKGIAPHLLVMSATPIPRSLALALYGDLDFSLLDQKPPGRQPVRTEIRTVRARPAIDAFLRKEIAAGGRVYMVYPLIEENPAIGLPALLGEKEKVISRFPGIGIGVLHGKMSSAEKARVQDAFRRGETQVLLATTVVEVGVDVPEASVMLIEGAERFGLSQLHQLRGRVGRGSRPSWCIAIRSEKLSAGAKERLDVFAASGDGFFLAEEDLRIRGPGELMGTRQWGSGALFRPRDKEEPALVSLAQETARKLRAEGRVSAVAERLEKLYRGWVETGADGDMSG